MNAIEKFVKNKNFEEFKIIGEAVKNISQDISKKHKEIHWKKIAGTRDRLTHFYFGLKYELLWSTIKQEIPKY